jgi:two-component system, chemotaxis family, protein-glutamate methylesterase/glutaminase
MIKVLVVDDSAVAREVLTHLINGAPGMRVVGTANDGAQAVEAVERLRPDIVTMDIIMPRMDGPQAIGQIMQNTPTPIVVVTGNTITAEVRATFESLDSGALAIVPRPFGAGSANHDADAQNLLRTLRLMSEIKVVRRLHTRARAVAAARRAPEETGTHPFRVVALGASTGGPSALKMVLQELRKDFPVPLLVVQHIAAGFVDGFVSWLHDTSAMRVRLAVAREKLVPGTVYVAPDGVNLGIDANERILLTPGPRDQMLCPSATHLFESVLGVYGPQAVGVLLTGMGRDGADALLKMKNAGAVTIAQDKDSSVVHGMPGEAIALGAADFVLPPQRIGELLMTMASAAFPLSK